MHQHDNSDISLEERSGGFPSCSSAYGHAERIFDVQFSPVDSSLMATASEDMTVRLWRACPPTGDFKQVLCCYGHEAEVMRIAWSADGRFIASGSADKTVRLWQAPDMSTQKCASYSGQELAVLGGHPEEVYHVEFLGAAWGAGADCQTVCAVSPDKGGGHTKHRVRPAAAAPATARGRLHGHLLVASSESLFVWDLGHAALVGQWDAPGTSGSTVPPEAAMEEGYAHAYIYGCAHQPSKGPLLACACNDGVLRFWTLSMSTGVQGAQVPATACLQYRSCKRLTPGRGAHALVSTVMDSSGARLAVAVRDGRVLLLGLAELQQAYARSAAAAPPAPREPNLYLLAFFQAPASLFSMANLPALGSQAGSSGGGSGREGQGQGRGEGDGGHDEKGCLQRAGGGLEQGKEGGGGGGGSCSRALLVATVDGRVRMYNWDDPGGTHSLLPHPLQQQQQLQLGSLPTLYAVAASHQGDAIAAAGQASTVLGLQTPPNTTTSTTNATIVNTTITNAIPSTTQAAAAAAAAAAAQGRSASLLVAQAAEQPAATSAPPGALRSAEQAPMTTAAGPAAAAAAKSASRRRRHRHSGSGRFLAVGMSGGNSSMSGDLQAELASHGGLSASFALLSPSAQYIQGTGDQAGAAAGQLQPSTVEPVGGEGQQKGMDGVGYGTGYTEGCLGGLQPQGVVLQARPQGAGQLATEVDEGMPDVQGAHQLRPADAPVAASQGPTGEAAGLLAFGGPQSAQGRAKNAPGHTHALTLSQPSKRAPVLVWRCS